MEGNFDCFSLTYYCKENHRLEWTNPRDLTDFFCCYICESYFLYASRWRCSICEVDVCSHCCKHEFHVARSSPQLNYEFRCINKHRLEWSTSGLDYRSELYFCDICDGRLPWTIGRHFCSACKFDVCPTCTGTHRCRNSHVLTWTSGKAEAASKIFGCHKCGEENESSGGRWLCFECNYELCRNCSSQPMLDIDNCPTARENSNVRKRTDSGGDSSEHRTEPIGGKLGCSQCKAREVEVLLIPCGHTYCEACTASMNECPVDRMEFTSKIRILF
mmetsp:Transcript_26243/g.46913  ORF Transcript_26243/g.46913 Transcript_26243/m.46913 type:complete len:274 (+) Transcript_26243:794-1615(+)